MNIKKQIQAIRDSAFQLNHNYNQVFHAEGGLRGEILDNCCDFAPIDNAPKAVRLLDTEALDRFFSKFLSTSGSSDNAICNSYVTDEFDFNAAIDKTPKDRDHQSETRGVSVIYGDPEQMRTLARLIASPATKYLREYSKKTCGREDSYFDMEIALSEWVYIMYEIGSKVGDPNLKRCYRLLSPLDNKYLPDSDDMIVGYSDTVPMTIKTVGEDRLWGIIWSAATKQELAYSKMGTDLFLASRIALDHLLDMKKLPGFVKSIENTLFKNPNRKTKAAKIAAIATHLQAHPTATSKVISEATGIHDSDVRRLWGPVKKAMKEGKSAVPRGYKNDGIIDGVDESASCRICRDPLAGSFECNVCNDIITGECKTCHFTQNHPDKAVP